MMRTRKEIEDAIGDADDALDSGSKCPGMIYEEGVSAALRWALGETDEHPLDE